jgi:parallel beta-helix repeat protein
MRYIIITISILFLLFQVFRVVSNLENQKEIVYVDSCDGVSDQIEINRALEKVASDEMLTTVYLKGKMRCIIDEPILISSNTILTGDSEVVVQLKDNIGWNTPNKPLIGQKNEDGTVAWKQEKYESSSISDIEISGFELSGGVQREAKGQYFVILINLYNASYVDIHDMNLHDSRGDIIRFYGSDKGKSTHLKIYNNVIENSGHEGIYFIYADNIEVYNNEIYSTRTNAGIRVSSGSNFSIHDNNIGNSLKKRVSGYAGILIDSSSDISIGKAMIYNNYIYGKNGGIVLSAGKGFDSKSSLKDVNITHNRLYKISSYGDDGYLNGAIRIKGFHNTLIAYNSIDGSEKDGIVYDEYDGVVGRGKGYKTVVRDNSISNCKGYGINNLNKDIHKFILENNEFTNNKKSIN